MLNAVIIFIICLSCIPYYFKYEKRKPQTRESVVLAVMIALTVASRMIFSFAPGFKPVSAMVIICGMAFGRESGFLCGSLSAVVSNFFFGQGPWTPFQMLAWGMIGWIAGILNQRKWLEHSKILLTIFGILIWNRIFLCHGYLDSSGSRRWISVYEICGSIRNFGSNNNRILHIKCDIFMDFNTCFCKKTKQG